jgi:pimeloyl-ACP methyl ester carboxylesterase
VPPSATPKALGVDEVAVANDLPVFAAREGTVHRRKMIFLAGMCVHPAGYVMSFLHEAAMRGDIVGLQGDVSCGGNGAMRRWSYDLERLNRRVDAAFQAAGFNESPENDIVVIGYSQGAELAEKLALRWPEKYSRAILIATPTTPSLTAKTKAVVLMAGTHDISRDRLRISAGDLKRKGVHATFLEIPNAYHGQLGDHPAQIMEQALSFLD